MARCVATEVGTSAVLATVSDETDDIDAALSAFTLCLALAKSLTQFRESEAIVWEEHDGWMEDLATVGRGLVEWLAPALAP
jgi:hypothetical protein